MSDDDPRDILRLKRCPKCGYDLAGLPRNHACPECGYAYDEFTFTLDVRAGKSDVERSTEAICFAIVAGMLALYGWRSGFRYEAWMLFIMMLSVFIAPSLLSWLFRMSGWIEHPRSAAVLFDGTGISRMSAKGGSNRRAYSVIRDIDIVSAPWRRGYRMRVLVPTIARIPVAWIDGRLKISRNEAAVLREELHRRLRDAKSIAPAKAHDRARD